MAGVLQASSGRLTAERRRGQLFAVALELFAQRGYRATPMDDMAGKVLVDLMTNPYSLGHL